MAPQQLCTLPVHGEGVPVIQILINTFWFGGHLSPHEQLSQQCTTKKAVVVVSGYNIIKMPGCKTGRKMQTCCSDR